MNIKTMPQYKAEATPGRADTHVISLHSNGNRRANLQDGFGRVTYMAVDDVREFDFDDAQPIAKAIVQARDEGAATLLVHCEMGVSRSVGVARAAAAFLEAPYENEFLGNGPLKRAVLRVLLPQQVAA